MYAQYIKFFGGYALLVCVYAGMTVLIPRFVRKIREECAQQTDPLWEVVIVEGIFLIGMALGVTIVTLACLQAAPKECPDVWHMATTIIPNVLEMSATAWAYIAIALLAVVWIKKEDRISDRVDWCSRMLSIRIRRWRKRMHQPLF